MSRLPVEGETFGRYRLLRRLGHGGMGVVYAALDTTLDREVALKLVAPHLADDEEFRARFAREATVLARLDSERAVRIYDHGEQDGVLFISTQLIEGGDLASLTAEAGALSPALAVEVVSQVLEGLGDAHAAGVIHRDVKPANVLVRQRAGAIEAFLCDFGIATSAGAGLTRTGSVAGSMSWMAPERHGGDEAGPAADLYSAGCLLWFALSGSAPYIGTEAEILMGHVHGRLPQLPGKDPFSKRMNAVLVKALAKEPTKRYTSAAAMRADLEALKPLAAGTLQLPGATAVRHSVTASRPPRWRAPVVAAAAVLAVVAAGLAVRAVAGEGEPTAGPDTVEVTQTVRGPHGRNIAEQRTLVPVPSASEAAEAGEPVVVPLEPGLAPPPAIDPPAGGSGGTDGPKAPASSAPAPVKDIRCWNGTLAHDRSGCGWPTGAAGARWVFPGSPVTCEGANPGDSRVQESHKCVFSGGIVYAFRGRSVRDAESYLRDRFIQVSAQHAWSTSDGRTAGWAIEGTAGNGTMYRWGRSYEVSDQAAWVVYIDATSAANRNTLRNKVAFRSVTDFQGTPL